MTKFFNESLERLLGIEGGWSNHKDDPGGATQWGITEATARKWGYKGRMKDLPLKIARNIYFKEYWQYNRVDDIALYNPELAWDVFDFGVNAGPQRSAEYLQDTLNLMNENQELWKDIAVDGWIGGETLGAIKSMLRVRGQVGMKVLQVAVECRHACYYMSIRKKEVFMYGWLRARIVED